VQAAELDPEPTFMTVPPGEPLGQKADDLGPFARCGDWLDLFGSFEASFRLKGGAA
jgi:hypothetical protein